MFSAQTSPDLDRQRFAAEYVDHRQSADFFAIAELILNEVEAPDFVGSLRRESRFAMHDHLSPTGPLAPQHKAFLAIKPVDQILADSPALSPQHD